MVPTNALVQLMDEGWNRHDPTAAEECLLHYREWSTRIRSDVGRAILARWLDAFPDIRCTFENAVQQGEQLAVRLIFEGTHRGPYRGTPPTQRVVRFEQMMFARLEGERLAEIWEVYDELAFWEQLGRTLSPPSAAP